MGSGSRKRTKKSSSTVAVESVVPQRQTLRQRMATQSELIGLYIFKDIIIVLCTVFLIMRDPGSTGPLGNKESSRDAVQVLKGLAIMIGTSSP